jgi:hypothetical protein
MLKRFTRKMNTLVQLISAFVPELHGIDTRSEAMVTCYPGNGTRYIRHVDNPNGNGRKLTVLYYLNHGWQEGDGGELRIHDLSTSRQADDSYDKASDGPAFVDIPPIGGTMVVFYSDSRVPHEVLPACKPRFAITHWFYDTLERREAELRTGQGFAADLQVEEARLKAEIAKFEARTHAKAQLLTPSSADTEVLEGSLESTTAAAGAAAATEKFFCNVTSSHVVYKGIYLEGMSVQVDEENRTVTVSLAEEVVQRLALHPQADAATLTVKRVGATNTLKLKCQLREVDDSV